MNFKFNLTFFHRRAILGKAAVTAGRKENQTTLNRNILCHVLAGVTIVLWASSYTLTPYALHSFSPTALACLRNLFASVLLVIFGAIKKIGLPRLRDLPRFFFAGALGITLYVPVYNWGAQFISGTTSGLILATTPIFTAILARAIFAEKIRPGGWLAIAVGFGGILLMTLWSGADAAAGEHSLWGILSVLASAILFSGYNLTQREYGKRYTGLSAAIYSIVCGSALLLVFLPEAIPQAAAARPADLLLVAYLGLAPAATGFVLWTLALSMAKSTSLIANYMFVTPFIAMLMGLALSGTLPGTGTLVGGAVIILGLVLFSILNKPAPVLRQK